MEEEKNNVPIFYINLVDIHHSGNDFLFDLKVTNPESSSTQLKIYMSPHLAKRLLFSLKDGVSSFENNYGLISISTKEILNNEEKK